MQKMIPEYAQKLLNGGYAFGNTFLSCHDGFLVIETDDGYYNGTQLNEDGSFKLDAEGYVTFKHVEPIIDEDTRFYH